MPLSRPAISTIVTYQDSMAGVEFIEKAFGFDRKMLDTDEAGRVVHCELAYGNGVVMVNTTDDPEFRPGQAAVYLVAPDPDQHFERAVAAGATEVYAPRDTTYDSREYAVRDPEGNTWYVGTYQP